MMRAILRSRFARDVRAVSAVEFALILPFMLLLYLGGIEISQAVAINRKTTLVSRTVSDLVAQSSTLTNAELDAIFAAADAIMSPYPAANVRITVSSVEIDGGQNGKVAWSRQKNSTVRPQGEAITFPSPSMAVADTTLIMAEAKYRYVPTFGSAFIGEINLSETIFMRPRLVQKVPEPTG
jgi:Flp pilus assembly protein TadG